MNLHTTRDLLTLVKVNAVISLAATLPLEELAKMREPGAKHPSTAVEHIVSFALGLVLVNDWQNPECENFGMSIESALAQLDRDVTSVKNWEHLFAENDSLGAFIEDAMKSQRRH